MVLRPKARPENLSLLFGGLFLLFVVTASEFSYAADNATKKIVFIAGKPSADY